MIKAIRNSRALSLPEANASPPWPSAEGALLLFKVDHVPRGTAGKQKVREVLSLLLNSCFEEPMTLRETPRGPDLHPIFPGRRRALSITYAAGQAWIAIAGNTPVGIDAVCLADLPPLAERVDLASTYLDAPAQARLRQKRWHAEAFAQEWCAHEARCKLAKTPLSEGGVPPMAQLYETREPGVILVVALPEPCPCAHRKPGNPPDEYPAVPPTPTSPYASDRGFSLLR